MFTGDADKALYDLNLAYLLLAQQLSQQDIEEAAFRFGVERETLRHLSLLTRAQLEHMAESGSLICRLRHEDMPAVEQDKDQ